MDNKQKQPRRYNLELRSARALDTRERILAAANELFTRHGIDKVTVDALSAAAGVSSPTVYGLFGSKVGILKALVEGAFFGEGYKIAIERTKGTTDPIELLRITASISRTIFDTEREEIGLMRGASAFSPELKKVEAEFEQIRYQLQEQRAKLLTKTFPRARALGLVKVRDIMWMYTGRDIYRMLVLERGWSSDEYEDWLANTLISSLTTSGDSNVTKQNARPSNTVRKTAQRSH
jgi:AcrR family transcriptional regulator